MSDERRKPGHSRPDDDEEEEELSSVSIQAYVRRDPMAIKVKQLETRADKLEGHFAQPEPGATRGGMIYELVREWDNAKSTVRSLPYVIVVATAVLGGVIWVAIHAAAPPPAPPPPSAQDIAREIVRAQSK